jgi:hypothetical protein
VGGAARDRYSIGVHDFEPVPTPPLISTGEIPPIMIREVILVADKYQWAMRPYAYLHNVFWSEQQPVLMFGFHMPPFPFPKNFSFYSLAEKDPGPQYWSDILTMALETIEDSHIVLMLEDYWLCRGVDHRGVATLHEYISSRPEVVRMDLTADRLYAGGMKEVDHYGCYDIVETDENTPYQMSTQAGIWNRTRLISLLQPGKSPWEVETQTQIKAPLRVLGSRQYPVRYANVFNSGKPGELQNLSDIPSQHVEYMRNQGWLK